MQIPALCMPCLYNDSSSLPSREPTLGRLSCSMFRGHHLVLSLYLFYCLISFPILYSLLFEVFDLRTSHQPSSLLLPHFSCMTYPTPSTIPSHMHHSALGIASAFSRPLYLHPRCRTCRDIRIVCLSIHNTALSYSDLAQCILRLVISPEQVLAAAVRDHL